MEKTLILGASGTVGTELVHLLKQKKQTVLRATSKKQQENDQVYLNLITKEGLENVSKVDKLFLLSPPGHVNQDELLIPLIEKAKNSTVKKIVLMTAMGVDADPSIPLRKVELHLERSGITYNIIRPNWFMQNFNSYWIHGINHQNKILLNVEDAKGSFIDARDIACVASVLLTSDQFNNQAFDLTGGKALNHFEVADIISKTSGRTIKYQNITTNEMRDGLLSASLPKDYAEFMLVILDFFRQGYSERITDSVEKIIGRKPITFSSYAEDYKHSWIV
jgi:uncharacterized protein YbjT (DUF2867 family)